MTPSREERIEGVVMKIATDMARLVEAGENRQREIDDLKHTLYGNGNPGIKESVRVQAVAIQAIETSMGTIQRFCSKTHGQPTSAWSRIWPPAVSTLLATAILAILAFSIYLWKIHPLAASPASPPPITAAK